MSEDYLSRPMTDESPQPAPDLDATRVGVPEAEGLATTLADAGKARRDGQPLVPGYELLRIIGRGGMGVVWEAIEHRLERRVALKVHIDNVSPERVANMWSEARLAARVSDPGVVAVHDLGTTLDGSPYYTMDLVHGTDLRSLLRDGPLPQTKALSLCLQIARAVAAAHDRGIVHRDLKPGNILIDDQGRTRILDFGLAHNTVVGEDRFENAVFGTPSYMSPEQVSAEPAGAPADVHAIGIILYEMLTGVRPFNGQTSDDVMAAIADDVPEAPSTKNPAIHVDVERTVLRCLEKKPEARFPSARKLATVLEALLEGRPVEALLGAASPAVRRATPTPMLAPTHGRERAAVHHRWSWKLASSASELWPLVANTDRLNKAIGLPEVEFTDLADEDGGALRKARTRVLGMELAWREYPFDWVKDREHSVYRQYEKGPVEAAWNRVQLVALPEGGTELVHEIWLQPRNFVGRMAASWEIGQKTGKNLDRVYHQLDAAIRARSTAPGADAFEPPFSPAAAQRRHVEQNGAKLVERGFSPAMVSKLTDHLLHQPTKLLERIRPYALARAWGFERTDTLSLFLHAANLGLVDIAWDLICPRCMAPHESFPGLSRVGRVGACVPCSRSYERDLRETVELVFRPHAEVRDATPTTYCAGAPALRPHILVQQMLVPGERRTVVVHLDRADYQLTASRIVQPFGFSASAAGFVSEIEVIIDHDLIDARPGVVRAGEVKVTLVNATPHDQIVRVEVPGARQDSVAAADVLTLSDFRDLFSHEMLAEGEHMTVSRMAFLFVDLVNRPDILKRVGDAGTWSILQKLDGLIDEQLRAHRGVAIPSSLDVQVAAFNTSAAAVTAAIALQQSAVAHASEPIRIAIHEGQCIALTRAGRTEFFGKTLHRGLALLDEAPAGGMALSGSVAGERGVAEIFQEIDTVQQVVAAGEGPYGGTRVMRLTVGGRSSSPPP